MRRTFEGKVSPRGYEEHSGYRLDHYVSGPEGNFYPHNWLKGELSRLERKTICVTIEIEEVSLRDRVAKIFDDFLGVGVGDPLKERSDYVVNLLKEKVLAEIDRGQ